MQSTGGERHGLLRGARLDPSQVSDRRDQDCRVVAVANSVQAYWRTAVRSYQPAETVLFTDATSTGCGNATSSVGPFTRGYQGASARSCDTFSGGL